VRTAEEHEMVRPYSADIERLERDSQGAFAADWSMVWGRGLPRTCSPGLASILTSCTALTLL